MTWDRTGRDLVTRAARKATPPFPATRTHPLSGLAIGRKLWLAVHKYIGLFAGAVFVLIGLTGSILAFGSQIDTWLNADVMSVEPPANGEARYRTIEEILTAAKSVIPTSGKLLPFVLFPRRPGACFRLVYSVPAGQDRTKTYDIFVNPYSAAVTGQRLANDTGSVFARPFIEVVGTFHYTLLLGDLGETAVGFIALFLFGSLLSGIVLFWPWPGRWRQALTIKWGATKERFIFDLHRTTGIYACLLLGVMFFSGIYMIFKPQVRAIVELVSPVHLNLMPVLKSERRGAETPLGPDSVAAIVDRIMPDGELTMMQLPDDADGVYVVGKRAPDEVNFADAQRRLVVDQNSGKILYIQEPKHFTAGEKFLEWQYPLHSGEAFGTIGRTFIMVMGFVPLTLYVTGFLRWRQKWRGRRQ
ncbi:MAG: PepSY-associated TM helix domain-containing protein [Methylocella sp.]